MFLCNIDIKANSEKVDRYYIGEDYIVIDYVRYEMINNVIIYKGHEYELIDNNLYRTGNEGSIEIIPLPVEQNRIKDESIIRKLNMDLIMVNRSTIDNPNSVGLPYFGQSSNDGFAESPYLDFITGSFNYILTLSITGVPSLDEERYTVMGIYGDGYGNWHSMKNVLNYDFYDGKQVKYLASSDMRYVKFFINSCYYEYPFNYTVNKYRV